jgi:hypothetical protein
MKVPPWRAKAGNPQMHKDKHRWSEQMWAQRICVVKLRTAQSAVDIF